MREDAGWQGFADVPVVLPAEVTINAVGRVDDAGVALAGFLRRLAAEEGVGSVALVGHSMGGLFSRAAIRELGGAGPRIERLVTLGTPWDGSVLGDLLDDEISEVDAHGDPATLQIFAEARRTPTRTPRGRRTRCRAGSCASGTTPRRGCSTASR